MSRLINRYPMTSAFLAANVWMTMVVWMVGAVR